jgi:pimeloyl-ACP methyl ester carboxylesterase
MPNPTILLIPGSFVSRNAYQTVVDKLRAQDHPALAIDLLSTQKRAGFQPATLQDDAAHIRSVTEALLAQGKEVVVVCHSYGGTPTTEALADLGVKRIVYLTAVVPRIGQSHRMVYDVPQVMIDNAVVSCIRAPNVYNPSTFELTGYHPRTGTCILTLPQLPAPLVLISPPGKKRTNAHCCSRTTQPSLSRAS